MGELLYSVRHIQDTGDTSLFWQTIAPTGERQQQQLKHLHHCTPGGSPMGKHQEWRICFHGVRQMPLQMI